jgi:hypothetical protein
MTIELCCSDCGKHMATLRDAKVRDGIVVYCRECDERNKMRLRIANTEQPYPHDVLDFLRGFFRGG